MDSGTCLTCGKALKEKGRKFCGRACYAEAYRKRLISNLAWFPKGGTSPNKGRTLESWVGEERAKEIKLRMSANSKKKAEHLRRLNDDPSITERRLASRRLHDQVLLQIVETVRGQGRRCFLLSEYVKERRIPDAIIFDGRELVALEIETEKRWKPSRESTTERLVRLNGFSRFFDRTVVVFARDGVFDRDGAMSELLKKG